MTPPASRVSDSGIPEGFIEAFANFYSDLADMLHGNAGRELSIPTGADGLIGVQVAVEAAIASHTHDAAWVALP